MDATISVYSIKCRIFSISLVIQKMKRLIFDLDNTICFAAEADYINAIPNLELIAIMRDYKKNGFEIIIATSRNVRTYESNIGKINANTLPIIVEWLRKNNVPFDEIYVGKPWCGDNGFYIDDKAIRPTEFVEKSYAEICAMLRT